MKAFGKVIYYEVMAQQWSTGLGVSQVKSLLVDETVKLGAAAP